jgi:hypothetical protein
MKMKMHRKILLRHKYWQKEKIEKPQETKELKKSIT